MIAMTHPEFQLSRDTHGRLLLITADGTRHAGVLPVRAFPIAAPMEGIALIGTDGHEIAWIEHLDALPAALRQPIEEELASREFMPQIHRLKHVTTFATPSTWSVDTDRGPTRFILKGEEDIRRLGTHGLLITDHHGIQFMVKDLHALDRHSRRLLDRFL